MSIINPQVFHVDTLLPITQTAIAVATTKALISFGKVVLTPTRAFMVTGVASFVAAVANKIFGNHYYLAPSLSTAIGVTAGFVVERILFPASPAVVLTTNAYSIAFVSLILLTTRFAHTYYFSKNNQHESADLFI